MSELKPDLLIENAKRLLGITEEQARNTPRHLLKSLIFGYMYGSRGFPSPVLITQKKD